MTKKKAIYLQAPEPLGEWLSSIRNVSMAAYIIRIMTMRREAAEGAMMMLDNAGVSSRSIKEAMAEMRRTSYGELDTHERCSLAEANLAGRGHNRLHARSIVLVVSEYLAGNPDVIEWLDEEGHVVL